MSELRSRARAFLAGKTLSFAEADELWRGLKSQPALARQVLERIRSGEGLSDALPDDPDLPAELCRQQALLTSKDLELAASVRHDRALAVLDEGFDLASPELDGDAETLGIAGGIHKRRWDDLGQLEDLQRAAAYYQRGAKGELGDDAYAHINAAFLEDLLADAGDAPEEHRARAAELRRRIVAELPVQEDNWWNAATRAEAHLGLGNYAEATAAIRVKARPDPWQLQTSARQLAKLAQLRAAPRSPAAIPELRGFFEELLGGSVEAVASVLIGKVGLGLSGGGFRASFFHLGMLARLAELDVLRNVDVLSCVSGGSIVGACYWLALRRRLLDAGARGPVDYVALVRSLIDHFEGAVATGLREGLQGSKLATLWQLVRHKGALDSEAGARALEEHFYRPLMPGEGPLFMDQLVFEPSDHDPERTGSESFNPTKHNWLRHDNVPVLVLNATSVNTGHAWQFTPTWMGESPWAVHEVADAVPRLEWHHYDPEAGWRMTVGRAVAASACVPGIFSPIVIDGAYDDLVVQLVDGGVYDNQGAAALIAHSCNVVLVSDAAGQLELERRAKPWINGLAGFFVRSMNTLMERIRQAAFADLEARRRSGLLRGLMFLHMKDGLAADPIPLPFSEVPVRIEPSELTPSGIRREFQEALAEIRTDLNRFSTDESRALMACGYQMASKAFARGLGHLTELAGSARRETWPFDELLREITATGPLSARGRELLEALRRGSEVSG